MKIASVDVPRTALALLCADILVISVIPSVIFKLVPVLSDSTVGVLPYSASTILPFIFYGLAILMTNFTMGLYQRRYMYGRAVVQSAAAGSIVCLAIWLSLDGLIFGIQTTFGVFALVHFFMFAVIAILRPIVCLYFAKYASKKRLVLVGSQAMSEVVQALVNRASPPEFEVVGHYDLDSTSSREILNGVIQDIQNEKNIDEIVMEMNPPQISAMKVSSSRPKYRDLVPLTSQLALIEKAARWTDIETKDYVAGPELSGKSHPLFWTKRIIETALAFTGLVILLPVLLLTALAIKLEDGGPIFYRQERVGKMGRVFSLIKFRSMIQNAEADGKAQWAKKGDSRVTRVGEFIRKSRIDEVPQLINLVRGDMSLVGPRPERPEIVATLKDNIPNYDDRHIIRPGITGWAQINYPYGASIEDAVWKTKFDIYYIRNWTIWLDVAIIFQTIRVVLLAEGSR